MTGPVTTEALVEGLAHELARLDGWQDPNALWTDNLGVIARGGEGSPVYLDYVEDARALVVGPLAPLLAAHQQVTAERDEAREVVARCNNSFGSYSYHLNPHPAEQIEKVKWQARSEWQRAEAAEASLATATSELARLRAEGEAKDRALKVALDAYDAAVRESANAEAVRQDVLGRQGDHPDIGEIMDQVGAEEGCMRAVAARGIARADLVAAVRTALARAATAREGQADG